MRDLIGIIYIIFVCIVAYGVVSRALTMYSSIEFTVRGIVTAVFYQPYWFLYSLVEDEKRILDGKLAISAKWKGLFKRHVPFQDIIVSNTSSVDEIAEATVNHVLLAFHMLFINILLLSLLIAMFK